MLFTRSEIKLFNVDKRSSPVMMQNCRTFKNILSPQKKQFCNRVKLMDGFKWPLQLITSPPSPHATGISTRTQTAQLAYIRHRDTWAVCLKLVVEFKSYIFISPYLLCHCLLTSTWRCVARQIPVNWSLDWFFSFPWTFGMSVLCILLFCSSYYIYLTKTKPSCSLKVP